MTIFNLIVANNAETLETAIAKFVPEGSRVESFPVADFKFRGWDEISGPLLTMRAESSGERYFFLIIPMGDLTPDPHMHFDMVYTGYMLFADYSPEILKYFNRVLFTNGIHNIVAKSHTEDGPNWAEMVGPAIAKRPLGQDLLRILADYLDERYDTPHLFRKTKIFIDPINNGTAIDLNLETDDRELVDRLVKAGFRQGVRA